MQLSLIQNHIISSLKNADTLRYSQMRPDATSNDLYNYHLKFLISKGLVEKRDTGYTLSKAGLRHVADVHHTSDQANRLFKINVITIVSRIKDGKREILSQERMSQPSYGKISVMGGTIVKGESILEGATRKLREETGVTASFRLLGHERRILYREGRLFSDVLFPICYAASYQGEPINTMYGRNFWTDIDTAIMNENDPHDSILSIARVLQSIQENGISHLPLFYTENIQS